MPPRPDPVQGNLEQGDGGRAYSSPMGHSWARASIPTVPRRPNREKKWGQWFPEGKQAHLRHPEPTPQALHHLRVQAPLLLLRANPQQHACCRGQDPGM